MLEEKLKKILEGSLKPSSSIKPLKNQIYNFFNLSKKEQSIYKLMELAYLIINKKNLKFSECSVCNKKYKFINITEGFNRICSNKCEEKRIDNIISIELLIKKLLEINNLSKENNLSSIAIKSEIKRKSLISSINLYKKDFKIKKSSDIMEFYYIIINKMLEPKKCDYCNNKFSEFININQGYREYCSSSCSYKATNNKREQTNKERYGVNNTFLIEKSKKNQKLFFEKNPNIYKKQIEIKKEKYGDDLAVIGNKISKTWSKKSKEEKLEIKEKREQTKKERYKNKNYSNVEKRKITKLKETFERKKKIMKLDNIVFIDDEFKGVENHKYDLKCLKCGFLFKGSFDNGLYPKCKKCNPSDVSKPEIDIKEYIQSLKIEYKENDKDLLEGLELDLLIKAKNLAIELNGVYYNSYNYLNNKGLSENNKKRLKDLGLSKNIGKNYHLMKTLISENNKIQLLHIYDLEWNNPIKKEIWKSIIKNKLGLIKNKIYARNTYVKEIPAKEARLFLEKNHLDGYVNAKINIGLFDKNNNSLLSVMTFSKPRALKTIDYEMYRFASLLNYNIIGGASKIFKYFIKIYKPKSVLSYANRRLSYNGFYNNLGFITEAFTLPGFVYFKKNKMFSRESLQKHKLKKLVNYKEDLSATEILHLEGYDKIYNSGNVRFVWYNNKKGEL